MTRRKVELNSPRMRSCGVMTANLMPADFQRANFYSCFLKDLNMKFIAEIQPVSKKKKLQRQNSVPVSTVAHDVSRTPVVCCSFSYPAP
jgi:hypothetical protein